jgi:hypothetical protein
MACGYSDQKIRIFLADGTLKQILDVLAGLIK